MTKDERKLAEQLAKRYNFEGVEEVINELKKATARAKNYAPIMWSNHIKDMELALKKVTKI
jgi:hypothetical protein